MLKLNKNKSKIKKKSVFWAITKSDLFSTSASVSLISAILIGVITLIMIQNIGRSLCVKILISLSIGLIGLIILFYLFKYARLQQFWEIKKEDSRLKVVGYVLGIILLIGYSSEVIRLIKTHASIGNILTNLFASVITIIFAWFFIVYLLKLVKDILNFFEKKYAIITKLERFKIFIILTFILTLIIAIFYGWGVLAVSPIVFINLFLDIYSKNQYSSLILFALLGFLTILHTILYVLKEGILEFIRQIKKKKWKIYSWLLKINNYLLLAISLSLLTIVIGISSLSQFQYGLPITQNINNSNFTCGNNVAEIIQNVPFTCKITLTNTSDFISAPQFQFIFINDNGSEETRVQYINPYLESQNMTITPPANTNMLSRILLLNDTTYINGYYINKAVYNIKEAEVKTQSRFTSLFAIIAFSFISIFAGVYYLKQLIGRTTRQKRK